MRYVLPPVQVKLNSRCSHIPKTSLHSGQRGGEARSTPRHKTPGLILNLEMEIEFIRTTSQNSSFPP